jgi:hypothetical protein
MATTLTTSVATPVTLLRAGAGVLGCYGYAVGLWFGDRNPEPIATIREWLNRPLGLGEDFGPFAVMLLLLTTGFLARHLVAVCLPLLVAVLGTVVAELTGLDSAPLVPLVWLTALQVVALLVHRDRAGWLSVVVLLAGIGVACVVGWPPLGWPLELLPVLLVGVVTRRVLDGALPVWAGLLLGAGCFAAIIAVNDAFPALGRWWYPVAATIAVLLFLALTQTGPTAVRTAEHPAVRWLADAAEWLVLVGPVVTFAVLGLLT